MEELIELRHIVQPKSSDIEISVGDFIGKGPFELETLRYIKEHNILAVRGNHEDKLIRYHYHRLRNSSAMSLDAKELKLYERLQSEDMEFLIGLPLYLSVGRLTIVHAGVLPSTHLDRLSKKDAAKIMRVRFVNSDGHFVHLDSSDPTRHFWWSQLYDGRYGYIVYGHQPFRQVRVDRWSFGIDTAAVYGNRLTAFIWEDGRYSWEQVKSQEYAKAKRWM